MWIAELALIRKETSSYLRGKKPFYSLCGFFLFYSSLLVLFWPEENFQDWMKILYPFILMGLCFFFVMVHFLVVAMGATMFITEKEQGTLDLLRMTLLSPSKLISGKLAVIFLYVLVLFAALLPSFSLLLWSGVVDGNQIFATFFLLWSGTFLNGIVALWISANEASSVLAVRKVSFYSLFFLIGIGFFGSILLWFVEKGVPHGGALFTGHQWLSTYWWLMTVPFCALISIYTDHFFPKPSSVYLSPWMLNAFFSVALSLFFFVRTRKKIVEDFEEGSRKKKISKEWAKEKKKRARIARSKWALRQIMYGEDAVLKKELLCYSYPHRGLLFLKRGAFGFLFLILFILYHSGEFSWNFQGFFCFELLVLPLMVGNSIAASLNNEIHQENFSLLRSSLITPMALIGGKLKAFFYFHAFEILFLICFNYTLMTSKFGREASFLYVTLCNIELILVLFVTMQGALWAGSATSSVNMALRLNYIFYFLFSGVFLGLLSLLLVYLFFFNIIEVFSLLSPLSPFFMVFSLHELFMRSFHQMNIWGLIFGHILYLSSCFIFSYHFCVRNLKKKWMDP